MGITVTILAEYIVIALLGTFPIAVIVRGVSKASIVDSLLVALMWPVLVGGLAALALIDILAILFAAMVRACDFIGSQIDRMEAFINGVDTSDRNAADLADIRN